MRTRKSCDNRWTKEEKFNSDSILNLKKKIEKKIPFLAENVCIAMWEMVQSKEQYFFYYHEQKFKLDWLLPEGMGGGVIGMTSFCLFDAWVFNFVSKRILKAQSIPINPQPPSSICPWK